MNYLLDTHTFLWLLFDAAKLSTTAQAILTNVEHTLSVSTVTYWEISLKHALGKLELQGITPDQLPACAHKLLLQALPITEEDAATFYQLPRVAHKDPFDRLLIWQAIRHELTLISKDQQLLQYAGMGLHFVW
jgi:PIN domain nuclease of toxin-antitoxin system